jgi:hypothetical protein
MIGDGHPEYLTSLSQLVQQKVFKSFLLGSVVRIPRKGSDVPGANPLWWGGRYGTRLNESRMS